VARYIAVSVELFEDHPIAGRPYCPAFAWLDLIRRAKWKDGAGLERGQLRASVRFLAEAWGWNIKKVHTLLTQLEADHRIVWVRPPAGKREPGVLTILEYETYQTPNGAVGNAKRERNVLRKREPKREEKPVSGTLEVDLHFRDSRISNASSNAPEIENRNESLPVPILPTNSLSLPTVGKDELGVEQGLLLEVPLEPSPKLVGTAMTARWIEEQAARPPESEIKKQHRTFLTIARTENIMDIAQAWEGIGTLYPYSEGRPWDAFDLRKQFGKAFQAGHLETADGDPQELAAWLREYGT